MADNGKKKDPTVSSNSTAEPTAGVHEARPVEQADDYAGNKSYSDNPDKPSPDAVAQVEDGTGSDAK
jgi:hypothetical protein